MEVANVEEPRRRDCLVAGSPVCFFFDGGDSSSNLVELVRFDLVLTFVLVVGLERVCLLSVTLVSLGVGLDEDLDFTVIRQNFL